MLKGLKDFTVRMIAGANVATVVVMLLVGYSDLLNPLPYPAFSNAGLLFPVFLLTNLGFLVFWLLFRAKYAAIPVLGLLVAFVPVRQYMPINVKGEAPKGSIKVLSYNTWNFGDQTEDDEGHNICLEYLQEQDADIVCLQEAMPNNKNIQQIDSMLKPMYAYCDTTRHPKGGNCLMVLSKFPILSKELIPYESDGNMSVAYRLKIKNRIVLLINNHLQTTGLSLEDRKQFKNLVVGKLQVDTAEQTSKLLVVKLAEATRKRAPQAEAVAKYIERHKAMSIILCGDFNDGPISYTHHTIAKNLTDCYVESGNGPGISYHHSGFFVRIDNIMCSKDWEPYECKVDDKIAVSDHYPIICKLKMRPKHQK